MLTVTAEQHSMEALEAVAAIHQELICPLCHKPMRDPQTFNTPMCGHTFCRECVIATLEGPGIVKSQCPTCRQPSWKKDLHTNHKYTAVFEATVQLEAVLRHQGLDFGLFDGLDDPALPGPDPADLVGRATAADQKATNWAGASQPPAAEGLAVGSNNDRAEEQNGPAGVLTASQRTVTPAVVAETAAQKQHDVDSGSDGADAPAEPAVGQANSEFAAEQQHPLGSVQEDYRLDQASPVDHADATAGLPDGIIAAAAAPCSLRSPERKQQMQRQQTEMRHTTQPPTHLQQLLESKHEEQLPGHGYWQFQQLLANMLCEAAVSTQLQKDEQEPAQQLPEGFCKQLSQLPAPTEADVQQMQADLWHLDCLLHDLDAQMVVKAQQQAPGEEQQQQQQEQPQTPQDMGMLLCAAEELVKAPRAAQGLQEQQEQQLQPPPAVAPAAGQAGSLGKRRRGRASGRSRAAGGLSNTACSSGAAGVSGGPAGAGSGGMARFSNCSGPLVEHQRSRPSLEKAFSDAIAAAEQAADLQATVADTGRADTAQQQQGQQPQQEELQQQQQLELGGVEAPISGSLDGRSVDDRPRRTRANKAAAAAAVTNSGSLICGAESSRRRSRRATTAAGAAKAQSQDASTQLARSLIGAYVAVLWPKDGEYFNGFITDYNPKSRRHTVEYDDGDVEKIDLDVEVWHAVSPQKSTISHQQQTEQQAAHPNEPTAGRVSAVEQQQRQLQQQRQMVEKQGLLQPQGPGSMREPAVDAPELTELQQAAGQPQGQQLQGLLQQQKQQQSIYSMQPQLLQDKGLARCKQPNDQQRQQQSLYELQQRLLATAGLERGRQQQRAPVVKGTKRAKAAAGKRKRQRHCGSHHEGLSSSSSSLCGSDETSGGDSIYEADEDAQDTSDSEEYAAAAAAGGSDASDGFMEQQKSRRTRSKCRPAAAKQRQQKQKPRCKSEPLVEAAWHGKQQRQQQSSKRPSEPPPARQQELLLLSESDPGLNDDEYIAGVEAAAAGRVLMHLTAEAHHHHHHHQQQQRRRRQRRRRQQQRHDQLLEQEAEAAWAVMSQRWDQQLSSRTDEDTDSKSDPPDSDMQMQREHDTPSQPAGHSSEDDSLSASEQGASEQAGLQQQTSGHQQLQQQQQRKPAAAAAVACPMNPTKQQQQDQHCDMPGAVVHVIARVTDGCAAVSSKYCDLLSDNSMGTSGSDQRQEPSTEQDENAVAVEGQHHSQLKPTPHAAAGTSGVAQAPKISTAHMKLPATRQRRPLDALTAGKQQIKHTADIAAGRMAAGSTQVAKTDLLPALTAGRHVTSAAAAAAKGQRGATEAAAAADGAGGSGAKLMPHVTVVGRQYAEAYKPKLQALGALLSPTNKYTYCVVLPVDEQGYFCKANKDVLKALVMGVSLVRQAWLEHSLQQGRLLPVEGYSPKGYISFDHNFTIKGGPDRSTATGRDDKRLFKDHVIVLPALQPTAEQLLTQKNLAQIAELGHAQVVLQGPSLDHMTSGALRDPIDAAEAAQLCENKTVLVVLFGAVEPSSKHALQQQWPTAKLLGASYLTDCICAYRMLDAEPYKV